MKTFTLGLLSVIPVIAEAMCLPPSCHKTTMELLSCAPSDKYEGVILEGRVVNETTERCADSEGELPLVASKDRVGSVTKFFYPDSTKAGCSPFHKGAALSGITTEACCDGDPNPPCLHGFSAYFKSLSQ